MLISGVKISPILVRMLTIRWQSLSSVSKSCFQIKNPLVISKWDMTQVWEYLNDGVFLMINCNITETLDQNQLYTSEEM